MQSSVGIRANAPIMPAANRYNNTLAGQSMPHTHRPAEPPEGVGVLGNLVAAVYPPNGVAVGLRVRVGVGGTSVLVGVLIGVGVDVSVGV